LAETAEVRIEQGDIDARDLAVHLLDVGLGRVESYHLLRLEPIRCQLQASSTMVKVTRISLLGSS
jgi:hypothetical protein